MWYFKDLGSNPKFDGPMFFSMLVIDEIEKNMVDPKGFGPGDIPRSILILKIGNNPRKH